MKQYYVNKVPCIGKRRCNGSYNDFNCDYTVNWCYIVNTGHGLETGPSYLDSYIPFGVVITNVNTNPNS